MKKTNMQQNGLGDRSTRKNKFSLTEKLMKVLIKRRIKSNNENNFTLVTKYNFQDEICTLTTCYQVLLD